MILTNVYEFEHKIRDILISEGVFAPDLIFASQSKIDMSNKNFKGLADADAVGAVILYEGFDPVKGKTGAGSNQSQRLLLRYRLLVVSPESLYYDNAGQKSVEAMLAIKKLGSICVNAQIIMDVHEFHLPDYTNNLVALPQLWQFEVII